MPVGSFPSNAWGLHDMHGNVWEWRASTYTATYDGSEQKEGAEVGARLTVMRGGGWNDRPTRCRSAYRTGLPSSFRVGNLGFRLVRAPRTH